MFPQSGHKHTDQRFSVKHYFLNFVTTLKRNLPNPISHAQGSDVSYEWVMKSDAHRYSFLPILFLVGLFGCTDPGIWVGLALGEACSRSQECASRACYEDVCVPASEVPDLGKDLSEAAVDAKPCQRCANGSECASTQGCVAMNLQGTEVGTFCLELAAGEGCEHGMFEVVSRGSVDTPMEVQAFCAPDESQTSCPAMIDFNNQRVCEADEDCGITGLTDALCRELDGALICSHPCQSDPECSSSTCSESNFCQ